MVVQIRRLIHLVPVLCLMWAGGPALAADGPGAAPVADAVEAPDASLALDEAADVLLLGRAAYEDGLYDLAMRRLLEARDAASDRRRKFDALLWLAKTTLAMEKPLEALAWLGEAAPLARTAAGRAQLIFTRAEAYAALGQWAEVEEELKDSAARFDGQALQPYAVGLLVRAHIEQQQWNEAKQAADFLEAEYPEHDETPAALLAAAAAMLEAGLAEEAKSILTHVEDAWQGSAWSEEAILMQAEASLADGRPPMTLAFLQDLATNPNLSPLTRVRGYQVVAKALARETDYAAALAQLELGLAASGGHPALQLESRILKAHLQLMSGQLEAGIETLRQTVAQIPDTARASQLQLTLAGWLLGHGHFELARREYQAWLDAFDGLPFSMEAWSGLGWALWEVGRFSEASTAFGRAMSLAEQPADRLPLLLKKADSHFAAGQYTRAKQAYAEALRLAPPHSQQAQRIQLQLAETELAQGETEAGEIRLLDLSRSRLSSEFTRAATMRLGVLYRDRGALETASEQYGRIIQACDDPRLCAEALLARGLIRYQAGSFQQALDDFTRIREEFIQTPSAAQAMFMRGWCLYLLGKDSEAREACEQFLLDYPDSTFAPDVHFWLGEYAFNHAQYEEAEARFAGLAADYPDSPRAPEALYWAGRAATARRAYLAANEHYNALMAQYPDNGRMADTLLAQGDVLSELGQFGSAIMAFDEGMNLSAE